MKKHAQHPIVGLNIQQLAIPKNLKFKFEIRFFGIWPKVYFYIWPMIFRTLDIKAEIVETTFHSRFRFLKYPLL